MIESDRRTRIFTHDQDNRLLLCKLWVLGGSSDLHQVLGDSYSALTNVSIPVAGFILDQMMDQKLLVAGPMVKKQRIKWYNIFCVLVYMLIFCVLQVLLNVLSTHGFLEQGACLDALIALMLDSTANQMDFESCNGIEEIAAIIRDKQVDETLRLRCGEFLLLLIGHVDARETPMATVHDEGDYWVRNLLIVLIRFLIQEWRIW